MFDSLRFVAKDSAVCLAVFHAKGAAPSKAAAALDKAGVLAPLAKRAEATGEVGAIAEAFVEGAKAGSRQRVLLVGVGESAKVDANTVRSAIAALGRKLAALKAPSVAIDVGGLAELTAQGAKLDEFVVGSAAGEALGLLGWNCDAFRGSATPAPKRTGLNVSVLASAGDVGDASAGFERGLALAEGANLCRTLSQTPPNIATPAFMANEAKKVARKHGLKISVLEGDALEKEKCVGLINVGKASENKPCLIRLEYNPKGAKGKPIVLVGKTMTYDTGGLSLKVNNGMVGMKRDKDGGCAVLGAMHVIAGTLKPKTRVIAYLAAAENSLSDEAYRPDDVLRYRNGVTVEVTNTDAEGRLVLADALCIACEKDNPACIIDLATLTGGVITALGSTYCGMFCDDDALRAKVEAASHASGERVWRLPMHQEYRDMMKSPVADIVNSNPNRKAHAGQGAAFLSYFVKAGVPWCHLDIAGVHVAEKNAGMFVDGPTGWGVRILCEMVG
jgi:leucyl aminopeptidase